MASNANSIAIVTHRGLHDDVPENSMAAFERAAALGAEWIECDVWASADGVPVVLHDPTLDRTTDGTGNVHHLTWEQLKVRRLRDARGTIHPEQGLPDLQSLIDVIRRSAHQPGLLVEIKPQRAVALVRATIDLLRPSGINWVLQSFDASNLALAIAHFPDAPVSMLVETREALDQAIAEGRRSINLSHGLLDEATSLRMRACGATMGVWTPNTSPDLRRCMELGARWIITDAPMLAMRIRRDFSAG